MTPEKRLQQEVIEKIKTDWEHLWQDTQGNFREDFTVKSQNAFFKSVETILEDKISIDSIRRFLLWQPAKESFQRKTLDVFSAYIGKTDYDDFLGKSTQSLPEPPKKKFLSKHVILTICLGVIISLELGGYYYYSRHQIKQEIERTIRQANFIQLQCYRKLPLYDTTNLSKYYLLSGMAYKDIDKVLVRNSTKRHWTISTPHNSSAYDFLGIEIEYLNNQEIKATVKESWHLQYFNADSVQKEEYTYKSIEPCACYFLKKEGNSWKIDNCLYAYPLVQNIGGELRTQIVNAGVCNCN